MNSTRLIVLCLATTLSLASCGASEEPSQDLTAGSSNALLNYVPAGTPYVFANLEPVPNDVVDSYLTRLQPVFDAMQTQLSMARDEMESAPENLGSDPQTRLAHALLLELDGKLNRAGLESLGFDLRAKKVVYGVGAFPMIRLGLSDATALRATLLRVLDNAELSAPEQDFQGKTYWRLADENSAEVPVGLYMSILEDHLALGVLPQAMEAELLPAFLGLQLPASSDAAARLARLNKAHDYTPYGSGIVDIRRLADEFIGPDTLTAKVMASSGEFDPATLSQQCVTEIHQIIDNTPLMTMGTVELTTSAVALQYRVETPETLGSQLLGLVSEIPAANKLSDRILEFSFGMRFGAVRDFVLEKVTAIAEQPYQCEHLQDLNESAVEALAKVNQPIPPFVNNFRGVRVSLSEFNMNTDSIPENARGFLAVHVEQPQMFIGMAQMFLPDLSNLAITPGDPPVRLPASLLPVPGLVAFAAMSSEAIGLALGEGEEAGLPEFLDHDAGPKGTFLSADYDMAAYMDYTEKLGEQMEYLDGDDGDDNGNELHSQAAKEIQQAASQAMKDMMDRSRTSMKFAADGLVIDSSWTFK